MNVNIWAQKPHLKKITTCGFPKLNDYRCFKNFFIPKSEAPYVWKLSENYNHFDPPLTKLSTLHLTRTTAFLVIKDNKILYEKYFLNFSKDSIFNSFSMAKTIMAILIGIAIDKGFIHSLDDRVSDYLPEFEFANSGKGKHLTIRHLLTMSSGLNWSENFIDPLSDVVSAYYSDSLLPILKKLQVKKTPGKKWKYQCGNTILLGLILQKATKMPLDTFVWKYFWNPLGANHFALWNKDDNDILKAFCCFYATARDFALIGLLLLNNGYFNGHQILPKWYVQEMIKPYKKAKFRFHKVDFYGLHTWIYPKKKDNFFYLAGMFGQYVIVYPKENAVFVRLGEMINQLSIRRIPPDIEFYFNFGKKILNIYENNLKK